MTILSIVLSLSILLAIFLPLLSLERCLKVLDGRRAAVCCIAVMIRALIPVEFPFSKTIRVSRVLPDVRDKMKYSVSMGGFSVKVSQLLLFVWILAAIILVAKKLLLYFQLQKTIRRIPECRDAAISEILQELQEKYSFTGSVRVIRTSLNISPLVSGIRNPVIVLPENPFSREEYRMILEHELLHCIRHDILYKIAADLLCSVYWWNPLFHVLKHKIFELIELGNDRQMTVSSSSVERQAYIQCLSDTAEKICDHQIPFTLSFNNHEKRALRRRIHLIECYQSSGLMKSFFAFALSLAVLWGCTSFTLEPYGVSEEGDYIMLTPDNAYFIKKNNSYELYYQDEYFYTVDSIEYYNPDIPIYHSEGE